MVEATIPAEQFALSETFRCRPSTAFEAVRVAVDGADGAMALLWATGDDLDGLSSVLDADPSTRTVEALTALQEEALFRVAWTDHVTTVCDAVLADRGTVLAAYGTSDAWTFRILFPEHDAVSATHDACEEHDLDVAFERIYDLEGSLRLGRHGLTESQYETIRAAYERGYYEVPRESTLADLAAELNVSHQALSERLRRGQATLVERVLRPTTAAPPRPPQA
jgi:predicted DNA binding protein